MQAQILGRNIELTEALKDYVNKKIQRLSHHFDHITSIHITLGLERYEHKAEGLVHAAKKELFAHAESKDMYASIDELVDKLDHMIIKHKEKLQSHE